MSRFIIYTPDRIYGVKEILIEQGRERTFKTAKRSYKLFRMIDGEWIQIGIFRHKMWNWREYSKRVAIGILK